MAVLSTQKPAILSQSSGYDQYFRHPMGGERMYGGSGRPAALTQSSGYYPFARSMLINRATDRPITPMDFPYIPDANMTTPIMDTEAVFQAARPYQVGDTSAYSPSTEEHRRLIHQPPQRMLIAGVDVPEATYGDELIDEIPPTVPKIDTVPPVLSQSAPGALSQTPQAPGALTGNARGSNRPPSMRVPFNEALIRIGGAIVGGSAQGGTAGLSAGANAYGQIQDANRAADMAEFEIAEARRQQIADSMARGRATREAAAVMPDVSYSQFALTAIEDVEKMVTGESGLNPFDNTTGFTGNLLSSVPGSAAHDVMRQLETVKAAIGFDRLQAMRDASPTGGALGQVTERELTYLQSAMGSLEQSQSKEQFLKNLAAVKKQYMRTVDAIRAQQEEYRRLNGLPPSQPSLTPAPSGYTDADVEAYINGN